MAMRSVASSPFSIMNKSKRARSFMAHAAAGGLIMGAGRFMSYRDRIMTSASGGTVGYGKRGIDSNAHGADGLVQGLSRRRRG